MTMLLMAVLVAAAGTSHAPQQGNLPAQSGAAPEAAPLVGRHWRLSAVGDEAAKRLPGGREPHVEFHPSGTVTGSDGCNSIHATFNADDAALKFGALMGTLMACPALNALDRRLREALVITRGWRIVNEELQLVDDQGKVLARFSSRPE